MSFRPLVLLIAAASVAGFTPNRAFAHDLHGMVKLTRDGLVIEASFSDETPAVGAQVLITDAAGNQVEAGRTDETGVCRLAMPRPGKYTAKIELIGHADAIAFEVAESLGMPEFANWRMNKTVGIAAGLGGLLSASGLYWLLRQRKLSAKAIAET